MYFCSLVGPTSKLNIKIVRTIEDYRALLFLCFLWKTRSWHRILFEICYKVCLPPGR